MFRYIAVLATLIICSLCIRTHAQPAATTFNTKRCNPLPQPRQLHGCAVVGSRLYVIGGSNDTQMFNDVSSAEIQPDGNLGAWRNESALPDYRRSISTSVEVVNSRIYVIGGASVQNATDTAARLVRTKDVLWTTVEPTGALKEWQRSAPFDEVPLTSLGTCSDDKHLFIIGGNAGKEVISNKVIACDFDAQGAPVNWRTVSQTPVPLWSQGSAIQNNRLFLWGGLTSPRGTESASPRVLAVDVQPDGNLGSWQELQQLSKAVYNCAFCGFNDYLVAVAGRYSGNRGTNDILFSHLDNGIPGPWQILASDLDTHNNPSLGLDRSRGWIFVTGGRAKEAGGKAGAILDSIQAFQITQPPASSLNLSAVTGGNGIQLLPAAQAFTQAAAANKNVAIFFYSPVVPACKRAWDTMMRSPAIAGSAQSYAWCAVDVNAADKTLSGRYSIYKVPAIVITDPKGIEQRQTTNLQAPTSVESILAGR